LRFTKGGKGLVRDLCPCSLFKANKLRLQTHFIVGCYANNDDNSDEKVGDDDDEDDDDTVMKLMVGTTESITKSFRKYLSNTLGKYNIMGLQNTAVLDTANVPGEVVMHKYKMFIVGNNITCTVGCSHRIAVLLYTLRVNNVSVIKQIVMIT
jgi:hypothetical protein